LQIPIHIALAIVTLAVLLGLEVGIGVVIALAWTVFVKRWPNDPVKRSVEWALACNLP
jgi:uncharacterized membrane protein